MESKQNRPPPRREAPREAPIREALVKEAPAREEPAREEPAAVELAPPKVVSKGEERRASADDAQAEVDRARAVYQHPILYSYRTTNDVKKAVSEDPTELILPTGLVCIGAPIGSDINQSATTPGAELNQLVNRENPLVFSFQNLLEPKIKVFVLVTLVLLFSIFSFSTYLLYSETQKLQDSESKIMYWITFASTFTCTIFGACAVTLRHHRLISWFIIVFYLDAFLNLFRPGDGVGLVHGIQQLICLHVTGLLNEHLRAKWYFPPRGRA